MKQPEIYVASRAISQSELKLFRKNITQFYNEVEMGERVEKRSTKSMLAGDIADCLLTNPAGIEDYYTDGISCSDTLQEIVELAIAYIKGSSPEWPMLLQDINYPICEEMLLAAANEKGWQPKWGNDAKIKNIKKDAGRYFELKALYPNKIVIAPEIYKAGKDSAEKIEIDPITGAILRGDGGLRKEQQLVLFGKYANTEMKGLLDHTLFDDNNLIIYPYDIKTVATMDQFISNYYKYGYGYQGSWYSDLLQQNYPDYKVEPFRFIASSTTTDEAPRIYKMPQSEIKLYAEGGYNRMGNKVIGWHETILELEWHRQTGNWLYPKNYYQNKELLIDSIYSEAEQADPL